MIRQLLCRLVVSNTLRVCVFTYIVINTISCAHLSRWIGPLIKGEPAIFNASCPAQLEKKYAALTIDDGPSDEHMRNILKVLAENQATATFFVTGAEAEKRRALLIDIVNAGHELANHTYTDIASKKLSVEEARASLAQTHALIEDFNPVRYVRPAKGSYGKVFADIAGSEPFNYELVLGDMYTLDHLIEWSAWHNFLISRSTLNGSVIILHDSADRRRGERTTKVLSYVLPKLKRRGFEIVSLNALAEVCELRKR